MQVTISKKLARFSDAKEVLELLAFTQDVFNIQDEAGLVQIKFDSDLAPHTHAEARQKGEGYFTIAINEMWYIQDASTKQFYKALIHEMTHVKQFVVDGLDFPYEGDAEVVTYQNQNFNFESNMEYWLAPWEVEARGYEEGIYNAWKMKK